MSELKARLTDAMKDAMRAKDKPRLGTLRMALAAIKQQEVDQQTMLDASVELAILNKQIEQRVDAAQQYTDADRQDLADIEHYEANVLREFLPEQLTDDAITAAIDKAIAETSASSMRDMGKVMAILKPQLLGRADLGSVSQQVKSKLA